MRRTNWWPLIGILLCLPGTIEVFKAVSPLNALCCIAIGVNIAVIIKESRD